MDEVALPAVDGRRVAKRDATLVGRAEVIWSTGDMAAVAHLEADAHRRGESMDGWHVDAGNAIRHSPP